MATDYTLVCHPCQVQCKGHFNYKGADTTDIMQFLMKHHHGIDCLGITNDYDDVCDYPIDNDEDLNYYYPSIVQEFNKELMEKHLVYRKKAYAALKIKA